MAISVDEWVEFTNRIIVILREIVDKLKAQTPEPDEPLPPDEPEPDEPVPTDEPDEPLPPVTPVPRDVRMGIGLDANGRTVFPEPRRVVTLRDDGTGTFNDVTLLNAACVTDQTIDEVVVSGTHRLSSGQWLARGMSPERPLVFRGKDARDLQNLWSAQGPSNLAFIDMDLQIPRFIGQPSHNLLFEGTRISGGGDGLVLEAQRPPLATNRRGSNLTIRLSVVCDNYRTSATAQGLFMFGYDDWLLEWTVFDMNGWKPPRSAATPSGYDQLRSQGVYIAQPSGPGIVRGCVFARPGATGIQMRGGGILEDCTFINCPVCWGIGYDYTNDAGTDYGAVSGRVERCVAIGADDIPNNNERGIFGVVEHFGDVEINDCAAVLNQTGPANNLWLWTTQKGFVGNLSVRNPVGYKWATAPFRNVPSSVVVAGGNFNAPAIVDEGYLQSLTDPAFLSGNLRRGFATPEHAMNFAKLVQAAAKPA